MAEVTTKGLRRNTVFSGLSVFWQAVSRFILTPLIIQAIGLEGYGAWGLLFGICAYVTMFNTGFQNAYSKFTAEYDRKEDHDTLSNIISSGVIFIAGLALVALTVIWIARNPILRLVRVPETMLDDAGVALLIISFCVLLRMSVGCFLEILGGLQRIDLRFKLLILGSSVEFVTSLTLLLLGHGLIGLALGYLTGQVLATGAAWFLCRRLCPAISVSPFRFSRRDLSTILSLGGRFQVLSIINTTVQQVTGMVISAVCGISSFALFHMARRVLMLAMSFSSAGLSPLIPAFASLHSGGEEERARALYFQASRLVVTASVIVMASLAVFADQVILAWTGETHAEAAWTVRVMIPGILLVLMTGVGSSSLRGKGTVKLESMAIVVGVVAMVLVIVPLYLLYGYEGMVLAVVVRNVAAGVWFLFQLAHDSGVSFLYYMRVASAKSLLVGIIAIVIALPFRPVADTLLPDLSVRWAAAFEILTWGALFAAATTVALWLVVLTEAERKLVTGAMFTRKGKGQETLTPS